MKRIAFLLAAITAVAGVVVGRAPSSQHADEDAAAISGGKLPSGYRNWRLISVAHEEGGFKSFAAVLGNDLAIKAYREGKLPFPDGTIIAALHWRHAPSEENDKVFGRSQSFVAGDPTNVQFMVKDSKKYASTGGWWFAQFDDGKPLTDKAKLKRCSDCHALNKDRDLVFTKYAPRYGNPLNNTNDLAPPFFPIGQGIRPSDSRRSAQDRARGLRRRRHT